ncbi:hypothetical protein SSP24_71520 [Streptomyces spinoverrucosus]|uniref:Glycosyltransferase 2-like domain-containing protein n=1 Tax=Streptomyces spinoverrucosus TaxID=284043 RepID=A0A4Y3VRL3_9ACTN|nr:hypothetical protein SSP24_71520 [Streptomyces spinoverrucosus]GHB69743.1 hypothetical protein GCM10010397_44910 [Streptomyces spinoverrucosus]
MPRFSIIVPSHGVEGRLARALESVLAQSFGDFELITVCDEPDALAADITAGYAGRDRRVRPAYSPPSAGLSAARTTGLRAASGAYLLFLDGDDVLVPGALAALDARLRETGPVDVLHYAHERASARALRERLGARPIACPPAPPGTFHPDAAPWLTVVNRPVWSAAYRRGFLAVHQLAFPYGHFTDLGWGGMVTVLAERVAVLPSVVVRHLMRAPGSLLDVPSEHQLDLLDQVELVLFQADAERVSAARSRALFDQLFAVVVEVAADARRLPARRRRAFFRQAGVLYRRYRPAGHRPPGVRQWLLWAGAYTTFRALPLRGRLLDDELDRDVAAGGVGVGADLVGLLDQLAAGRLVDGVGQLDAEGDGEREALALLADADLGGDGGLADVDLGLPADQAEGAAEAGRVPGGEELLGVGALAVAAQLHRRGQLEVDLAVGGDGTTIAAVGGGGDGGVERVHGETIPLKSCTGGLSGQPDNRK